MKIEPKTLVCYERDKKLIIQSEHDTYHEARESIIKDVTNNLLHLNGTALYLIEARKFTD
jgi:hypothetical protein